MRHHAPSSTGTRINDRRRDYLFPPTVKKVIRMKRRSVIATLATAAVVGALSVAGIAYATAATGLNPHVAPGGNFNLSVWELQLPIGSPGSPTTQGGVAAGGGPAAGWGGARGRGGIRCMRGSWWTGWCGSGGRGGTLGGRA